MAATTPPGMQPCGITEMTPANSGSSNCSTPVPSESTASVPFRGGRYRDVAASSVRVRCPSAGTARRNQRATRQCSASMAAPRTLPLRTRARSRFSTPSSTLRNAV